MNFYAIMIIAYLIYALIVGPWSALSISPIIIAAMIVYAFISKKKNKKPINKISNELDAKLTDIERDMWNAEKAKHKP